MTDNDFEAGIRAGEIKALKEMQTRHSDRLDQHEDRLRQQEKILWMLIGAIALIQAAPALKAIFG